MELKIPSEYNTLEFAKKRVREIEQYVLEVKERPRSLRQTEVLISANKLQAKWIWVAICFSVGRR